MFSDLSDSRNHHHNFGHRYRQTVDCLVNVFIKTGTGRRADNLIG